MSRAFDAWLRNTLAPRWDLPPSVERRVIDELHGAMRGRRQGGLTPRFVGVCVAVVICVALLAQPDNLGSESGDLQFSAVDASGYAYYVDPLTGGKYSARNPGDLEMWRDVRDILVVNKLRVTASSFYRIGDHELDQAYCDLVEDGETRKVSCDADGLRNTFTTSDTKILRAVLGRVLEAVDSGEASPVRPERRIVGETPMVFQVWKVDIAGFPTVYYGDGRPLNALRER